jgi:hypothetical protein
MEVRVISLNGLTEGDLNDFKYQGKQIPRYMYSGLINYANHGILPGKFLQAVICNNLSQAFAYADDTNLELLAVYVSFFHCEMPQISWGSELKMKDWHIKGGLLKVLHPQLG